MPLREAHIAPACCPSDPLAYGPTVLDEALQNARRHDSTGTSGLVSAYAGSAWRGADGTGIDRVPAVLSRRLVWVLSGMGACEVSVTELLAATGS